MKEVKDGITTLFAVFIVCKIVDFKSMTWIDYILCALLIVYLVILIIDIMRRNSRAKR